MIHICTRINSLISKKHLTSVWLGSFQLSSRSLSASSSENETKIPTIAEVRRNMMKLVGYDVTWGDKQIVDKSILTTLVQKDQSSLTQRRMKDSYAEAVIPLADEPLLQNRYANFQRTVRFGRLLEDLDTMAVHISYLHNKLQNVEVDGHVLSPIVIVTALVDRIVVKNNKIAADKNIKMSGFTSWVGKTSSEVTMKLEQEVAPNVWTHVSDAKFLLCARDANNKGAALMTPLELVTDEEKAFFELGEKSKKLRQNEAQMSLFQVPPNSNESLHIHEMFKKTIDFKLGTLKVRIKPENTVWMEDSKLKNIIICFPEQRNLYNKIFGGFLMRQAYELAWVNASVYSKSTPRICVVDDITFKRPVLIGSLLYLRSQVVYTQDNLIMVKVHAHSTNHQANELEMTNDFYFKFSVEPSLNIPQVMPKSYAESMMYLDGKRHM